MIYGLVSIIFIMVISMSYYMLETQNENQYKIKNMKLVKHIVNDNYEIYGACVDKKSISDSLLSQIRIKAESQQAYMILFNKKPYLQCKQLTHTLLISEISEISNLQYEIKIDDLPILQQTFNQVQIKKLSQQFQKINNNVPFILIIGISKSTLILYSTIQSQTHIHSYLENQKHQPSLKDQLASLERNQIKHDAQNYQIDQVLIAFDNPNYTANAVKPIFWFSWFNLILIILISYYRKHIFNNVKIKLLLSISLLVLLIFIGYNNHNFNNSSEITQLIKLAMLMFLAIITIKSRLNLCSTVIILSMSLIHQYLISIQFSTQIIWLIYCLNYINIKQITNGSNLQITVYSIFSFFIEYGLANQYIDLMNPLIFSVIVVNLIFGPTIYQLLQLIHDFNLQHQKNKSKLQSYQEADQLFKYNH